jgi:molybdopterin/thiamine biosynthesis adenylyltransferase/rhodanese-related sulfurtransferase
MSTPARNRLEVSVHEASRRSGPERPLIDIRAAHERLAGQPAGALAIPAESLLESGDGSEAVPAAGFIICAEGVASLDLAARLHRVGRDGYLSVGGGFTAWRRAGLPETGAPPLPASERERYARHLVMPEIGLQGQQKLLDTRVLLVGLGGLNSPAALYLAAAGVGRLGLADDDTVERSNLQRQILHGEPALGGSKAASAATRIAQLNPSVESVVLEQRVDSVNAERIVADWDIVVDGTDNFAARMALNEACVRQSKPLVYGAVMRFQGQVSVFAGRPCLRCFLPASADLPGCDQAGVLGVVPGIVGTLQAAEALKLALGLGQSLQGRLLLIDALSMEFRETRISPDPDCPVCAAPGDSAATASSTPG